MIFAHSFSERSAMAVRLQLPRKKAPNPTDRHVGSRVRMRRMMLVMSQGQLADALGITYQRPSSSLGIMRNSTFTMLCWVLRPEMSIRVNQDTIHCAALRAQKSTQA
jgi:hypothetical protein